MEWQDHVDLEECCIRSADAASDSRAEAPEEAGMVSKPEVAARPGSAVQVQTDFRLTAGLLWLLTADTPLAPAVR